MHPLPPALPDARRFEFVGGGHINCYVGGQGPPLLLVHSINAAASAAEMAPIFEGMRSTRTIFAIDLPGYGFSERSDRPYTPRLMTDALHALNAELRQRGALAANQPLDAVALSLSTEFLARAAVERPDHWGRLALISPTGLDGRTPRRAAAGSTRAMPWLHRLLSNPRWSQGLFNTLTRPGVIHYFLRRTFGSDNVDDGLWRYAVATARQPGARFAPLYFLSASLFSADIHTLYEALQQPVWVSHGVRGDFTDYRFRRLVDQRDNWRFTAFQAGAMPYFEQPTQFMAELGVFLSAP